MIPQLSKAERNFTRADWEKAKNVLLGNDPKGVSMKRAAEAAGITPRELKMWERRGREADPNVLSGEDMWIREIPTVLDEALESQGHVLEDVAWSRAVNGWQEPVFHNGKICGYKTRHDNNLLMKLLKRRDPAYREGRKGKKGQEEKRMTPEEAWEAMKRIRTMARPRQDYIEKAKKLNLLPPGFEEDPPVIEGEAVEVKEPAKLPEKKKHHLAFDENIRDF